MDRVEIENLAKEFTNKLVNKEGAIELYQKYGSLELTDGEDDLLFALCFQEAMKIVHDIFNPEPIVLDSM